MSYPIPPNPLPKNNHNSGSHHSPKGRRITANPPRASHSVAKVPLPSYPPQATVYYPSTQCFYVQNQLNVQKSTSQKMTTYDEIIKAMEGDTSATLNYKNKAILKNEESEYTFFNSFISVLKSKIQCTLNSFKQEIYLRKNEQFIKDKRVNLIVSIILAESQEYYKNDRETTFLACFQICDQLDAEYRDLVWSYLIKEFSDLSPVTKRLHTLAVTRKKPFNSAIAFLKLIALIHLSSKEADNENRAFTLKILSSIRSGGNSFEDLIDSSDLILSYLPKLVLPSELNHEFPVLSKKEISDCQTLEEFTKKLMTLPDFSAVELSFRLLITIGALQKINSPELEEMVLKIFPVFKQQLASNQNLSILFSNIRKIFPTLFSKEAFDRLQSKLDSEPEKKNETFRTFNLSSHSAFVDLYIKELLQQKEPEKQKLALDLWKDQIKTSPHTILFAEEIYNILTAKGLNHEVIIYTFTVLQKLSLNKTVSNYLLMRSFSNLYIRVLNELQKTSSDSYSKIGAKTAALLTSGPYLEEMQETSNEINVLKSLITGILKDGDLNLAFQLLHNAIAGQWLKNHDKSVHALALKVCELALKKMENNEKMDAFDRFQALDYFQAFQERKIFGSQENAAEEHKIALEIFNHICALKSSLYDEAKNQLLCSLFESPLPAKFLKQFRSNFKKHLTQLALLGQHSHISHLLKMQPHDLSKSEQNEILLLTLQSEQDEQAKFQTLLSIDKKSLNQESQKNLELLSRELTESLLKQRKIAEAIELASKMLLNDPEYLNDFLKTVLEETKIPNKAACQLILGAILSKRKVSCEDKVALITSSVQSLHPLSKSLFTQIKEMHIGLHNGLSPESSLTIPFVKALLKLFKPVEMFQRNGKIWLEILNLLSQEKGSETLKLKESLLKQLLDSKIITLNEDFRPIFQQLIGEHLSLRDIRAAINWFLQLEKHDKNLHTFSEIELSNLYECFNHTIEVEDYPRSLLFLRRLQKNENLSEDKNFPFAALEYLNHLFLKKDYKNWVALSFEFSVLPLEPNDLSNYFKAIDALLNNPSNAHMIFDLLTKMNCLDLALWNKLFESVRKQKDLSLKVKICSFFKSIDFFDLNTPDKTACLNSLKHLLSFINDTNDLEMAYSFFSKENKLIALATEFPVIVELLSKLFKSLPSNSAKKQDLIEKLALPMSNLKSADAGKLWPIYQVFMNGFKGEKNDHLIVLNCSLLFFVAADQRHKIHHKDMVHFILEFFKIWPKDNFENSDDFCYEIALQIMRATKKDVKELDAKGVAQAYSFAIQNIAPILYTYSKHTFFEQFSNLIQNNYEVIQLLAMNLYKASYINLSVNNVPRPNHKILEPAVKSPHISVFKEFLHLLPTEHYVANLKSKLSAPFVESVLKKLMTISSENFSGVIECEAVHILVMFHLAEVLKCDRQVNVEYLDYFNEMNDRLLENDELFNYFLQNHSDLFSAITKLFDQEELEFESERNLIALQIEMLKNCKALLLNRSTHKDDLTQLISQEINTLITQPGKMSADFHFITKFLFSNSSSKPPLFARIHTQNSNRGTVIYINFMRAAQRLIEKENYDIDIQNYVKMVVKIALWIDHSDLKFSDGELLDILEQLFYFTAIDEISSKKNPIHLFVLDALLSIEAVTKATQEKKIQLMHGFFMHYIFLYQRRKNSLLIKDSLIPQLMSAFNEMPESKDFPYQSLKKMFDEIKSLNDS